MGKLDGKVALIGGSLGKIKKDQFVENIGAVIAKQMQDEGAQVIVVDVDNEIAKKCAEYLGGNAKAMEVDLLKERVAEDPKAKEIVWKENPALEMVNKIAEEFGKIDIVVCAFDYFGKPSKVTKTTVEMYEELYKGNILPTFHLLAGLRDQLKAQNAKDGSYAKIVLLTSMVGKAGMSMGAVYAAFKGGIIGLTKTLSREFGRFANVNAVAAGPLKERKMFGPPDNIKGKYLTTKTDLANQPLTFDKIAPLVVFLASDDAIAINGQTYSVDGGLWLKLEQ